MKPGGNEPGPEAVAPGCATWDEVSAAARMCTACPDLVESRTQVVPGVRPAAARLLLIGEAPGAAEDASGLPFVGRSGQLLDEMLADAGLARSAVAVANVLKCRPPRNRAPRRREQTACRPWLERQIALVDPAVIVTLGSTALGWALGPAARIGVARADIHDYAGHRLIATYHPSAAIRFGPNGEPRRALREDLGRAAALLQLAAS